MPEGVEVGEPSRPALALQQDERAGEDDGAERDVDEQHPAPTRTFCEQTAEQDARGAADAGDRRPGSKSAVAFTFRSEGTGQAERGRREQAAPRPWAKRAPMRSDSVCARPPTREEPAMISPVTRTRGDPADLPAGPNSRKPP